MIGSTAGWNVQGVWNVAQRSAQRTLRGQPIRVDDVAADAVETHFETGAVGGGAEDVDRQETALDAVERLHFHVPSRRAAGVFVAGGAAGEFLQPGLGVDGMVLPMAVAAADEEVVELLLFGPVAEQVAFPGEVALEFLPPLWRYHFRWTGRSSAES